jgi:hypothetical protein
LKRLLDDSTGPVPPPIVDHPITIGQTVPEIR